MLTLTIIILFAFAIMANQYVKILFTRERHNNEYANLIRLTNYRT